MPVLITAGLSPEAYRLQRILDVKDVVFADVTELPPIPNSLSIVLPPHTSPSFVHEMLKSCLDHGISHVYPLNLGEVIELSKARALFSEYGVFLIIPSDLWLQSNFRHNPLKNGDVTVIEQGVQVAGSMLPDNHLLNNENGIFKWATINQKTEYSLYVV
jgi:hypothetical protein